MARDKNQTWEIGLCGGHSGPATQIIGPFKTSRAAHDAIKYLNDNRAEAKTKFSQRNDQWRVAYSGEITRATICGERKPPVRLYPTSLARVACYVREATRRADDRVIVQRAATRTEGQGRRGPRRGHVRPDRGLRN